MRTTRSSLLSLFFLATCLLTCVSFAESFDRRDAPVIIAELRQGTSTLLFEQIDDGTILLTEISDPLGKDESSPVVSKLMEAANEESISLCPAQIFGLLSTQPIPASLWRACKDLKAFEELQRLRMQPKDLDLDVRPITSISSYCVGATGYQTFRTRECSAMLTRLEGNFLVEDDSSYWCANTLRKSTNRTMSGALDEEGERAEISAVSCTGNTQFRFYMRSSTGNSWSLIRDYQLGSNQRIALYAYDDDSFGDSDFRFRLDSGSGAWHRSTGFFLDE